MAAFRNYANGRWAAVVRRKGHRPQCKVFATHSDAKRWANQIESEIDRAVFVDRAPSERITDQTVGGANDFFVGILGDNTQAASGAIDEMGFWKGRALSQTDIATLWNGGSGLPLSSF